MDLLGNYHKLRGCLVCCKWVASEKAHLQQNGFRCL